MWKHNTEIILIKWKIQSFYKNIFLSYLNSVTCITLWKTLRRLHGVSNVVWHVTVDSNSETQLFITPNSQLVDAN